MILIGDIHGNFDALLAQLQKMQICNQNVILVGDCGLGFYPDEDKRIKPLHNYCFANNITIYFVRGNHDNPYYWIYPYILGVNFEEKYSNFKILVDGVSEIEGKNILVFGGAISVDSKLRKEYVDYWKDEKIHYDVVRYVLNCIKNGTETKDIDCIITHASPNEYIPVYPKSFDDPELDKDIKEERDVLSEVYEMFPNTSWYFGHYHLSNRLGMGTCLDIMEMKEIFR